MSEAGLVRTIRDIYDFFYRMTGERYTKTPLWDCYSVFEKATHDLSRSG